MSTRLSQWIAVEKGIKNQSNVEITAAYHELQKATLFTGIARTYTPRDEEGEKLPSESQKVQKLAESILDFTGEAMTRYWDVTLTKDNANTLAKADVIVDGKTLLTGVPVTFLLFLEKQLGDLATMVKKLPTLDPGETWTDDAASGAFATTPSQSTRTKKIMRAFTAAEATKEHPAQVTTFTEDVVVGTWTTVKYSGALPQRRVATVLERIGTLQAAVKFAREEANMITAEKQHIGGTVFGYLLA